MFKDEHKQQPIIIGSFAGIPEPFKDQKETIIETAESSAWKTADGSVVGTLEGPLQSGSSTTPPKAPGELSNQNKTVKKPTGAMKVSEDAYTFIRNEEACSSKVPGQNKYVKFAEYSKMTDAQIFYAYQDTVGVWTIGWGNTYLADGSRVNANTKLSKPDADKLMKYWVDKYATDLAKSLRAPVTQSMFDSLVSMMYNSGPSIKTSAIVNAVNSMDYAGAATQISVYKTNGGSLSDRRKREKAFFSKDGFPSKDLTTVEDAPSETSTTANDASENPVVVVHPSESNIAGGTIGKQSTRSVDGFRDPNGVYPKLFNEPDTHRLARSEKVDQTIVYSKESARAKGVISGGNGQWSQPKIPYNAQYPYNHVKVTESGHVQEFDDTKGSERIHTYHRTGTYTEIDCNGTRVNRIVGDDYEILERNGNVLIRGSLNVTIIGNQNIRVENNANIDVLGDVNMTVGGTYNLGVNGDINMAASGNIMMHAGGVASIDAALIHENSGREKEITMGKGTAGGLPEFPTLTVPDRNAEAEAQYESPEDGDPSTYSATLESAGVTDSNEPTTSSDPSSATDTPSKEPAAVPVTDCSMIPQTGPIDTGFKLSKNFVLKDLNGDRLSSPPAVNLTKAQIACNLKALAENLLEPIKAKYPSMKITSGYRNSVPPGGATNSDHLYGCAADIQIGGFNRTQHYEAALEMAKFLGAWTQIILEGRGNSTWIHVAFNSSKGLKMEKFTMNTDKRISPSMTQIR
jgi:GH24 family phage-related lysozyme (muramidase)